MDAAKLLNVLLDLERENDTNLTASTLNTLINRFQSGQTSDINTSLTILEDALSTDIMNRYSPSNRQIASSIGAYEFFGRTGWEFIKEIFDRNSYNSSQTLVELQEYVSRRKSFITLVEGTQTRLFEMNILPHFPEQDTYEIGLLMSKKATKNTIHNVTKELNHWDKVFKTLKELTGETPEDSEINFINNGSLQFFLDHRTVIATCLSAIIAGVIGIFKKVTEFQQVKEQLKALKLSTAIKNVEKQEKQLVADGVEQVAMSIIDQFVSDKIKNDPRLNEVKVAMRGHVKYIARCMNDGITIEINPPEIDPPSEVDASSSEADKVKNKELAKEYEKRLKEIEVVNKAMDVAKAFGKPAIDAIKYLTEGDAKTDDADKDEKDDEDDK